MDVYVDSQTLIRIALTIACGIVTLLCHLSLYSVVRSRLPRSLWLFHGLPFYLELIYVRNRRELGNPPRDLIAALALVGFLVTMALFLTLPRLDQT